MALRLRGGWEMESKSSKGALERAEAAEAGELILRCEACGREIMVGMMVSWCRLRGLGLLHATCVEALREERRAREAERMAARREMAGLRATLRGGGR